MASEPSQEEVPRAIGRAGRRRWLQFNFRTLLIVVTLIAVVLGIHVNAARRQRVAADRVRSLGGTALYTFDFDSTTGRYRQHFRPDSFWEGWLGLDFFHTVASVRLQGAAVTDDDLTLLRDLPDLEDLHVGDTRITDRALPHFRGLHKLRRLNLQFTKITDAGLVHLEPLESLRDLHLGYNSAITGEGMKSVGRLAKLRELSLLATQVSDGGLQSLTGLKELVFLDLQSTRITGPGLVHLKQLPALRTVHLRLAPLSEDAVQVLGELRQVGHIGLGGNLSAASIKKLQAALPKSRIESR